ncbi:Mur ligase family protein [Bacillus benzoevorans]|uniref:UDP-N-acetylmuramoyl-tripeptide--D-alanyl-D-alanine ligase n=1 Tax=Bacillus benzoevorans TaxID=1456 RepID=A0A7X0HRG0_9BACI|nr:UDP-N-acetylmuramoyl-tripeptide--D-alanyl-D-alanine ligase [Bacillus benzoevorans]MBB6445381.1 UDP-N-acetylmuramoyl-tripeptide--D-alanyl-D-alanine ligase [Bacillus benzoevorans]
MIHIVLREIVQHLDGHVIHGRDDHIMKSVIKRTKKDIDHHTLLFHVNRDSINGQYWSAKQAVAVVTDVPEQCKNLHDEISVIAVDNVKEAYWKFIDYYRGLFDIPVIGVTGTCGKTTTKEMIAQMLEHDYNIDYTWMSMNSMSVNLRYLMRLKKETEIAVYEMPVAYPGYLKIACRYFKPQIRVLLNIDVHHLADCETPEVYMKAKGEITDGLDPETGILILNGDDENIKRIVDVSPFKQVIYFGKGAGMHFHAEDIQYGEQGMRFKLQYEGKPYHVYVPGLGEHNVYNALAALAAVVSAGVDLEKAIQYLADFEHVEEHLEFKSGVNGCTVIDDTWNSSPLSMKTGLQVLKEAATGKLSIALLGYMPQLGDSRYATLEYRKLGETAVHFGIDLLIVVGKEAVEIGKGALDAGMDQSKVFFCETGTELNTRLQDKVNKDTVLLLKITHRVMKQPSFKTFKKYLIPNKDE